MPVRRWLIIETALSFMKKEIEEEMGRETD